MSDRVNYIIWIKQADHNQCEAGLVEALRTLDAVDEVEVRPTEVPGLTRKEAILAVTLSVTANFATDGIKEVIDLLREQERGTVVHCRKPDGKELDLTKFIVDGD